MPIYDPKYLSARIIENDIEKVKQAKIINWVVIMIVLDPLAAK